MSRRISSKMASSIERGLPLARNLVNEMRVGFQVGTSHIMEHVNCGYKCANHIIEILDEQGVLSKYDVKGKGKTKYYVADVNPPELFGLPTEEPEIEITAMPRPEKDWKLEYNKRGDQLNELRAQVRALENSIHDKDSALWSLSAKLDAIKSLLGVEVQDVRYK